MLKQVRRNAEWSINYAHRSMIAAARWKNCFDQGKCCSIFLIRINNDRTRRSKTRTRYNPSLQCQPASCVVDCQTRNSLPSTTLHINHSSNTRHLAEVGQPTEKLSRSSPAVSPQIIAVGTIGDCSLNPF